MIRYILRRCLVMVPTLILISMLVFIIIELPPGDYFESYIAELKAAGEDADLAEVEELRSRYGFDQPAPIRYLTWVGGMLVGDFGYSFEYQLPVRDVIGDRLILTVVLSFLTIIFTWVVAFPIGNDSSGSTSKGVQALQLLVGGPSLLHAGLTAKKAAAHPNCFLLGLLLLRGRRCVVLLC
jgi:ABC-type dipeptide/oligopeptide/nickel transport system permease component